MIELEDWYLFRVDEVYIVRIFIGLYIRFIGIYLGFWRFIIIVVNWGVRVKEEGGSKIID